MVQPPEIRVMAPGRERGLHDLEVEPVGQTRGDGRDALQGRGELAAVGVEPATLGARPLRDPRGASGVDVEHEQVDVVVTGEQHRGGAAHRARAEDRDPAQPVTLKAGRATGP